MLIQTRPAWARRDTLLVIDGYEQLSRAARCMAVLLTWSSGAGILVTSHRQTCLPTLIDTHVDVSTAQGLLQNLLPHDMTDRERYLELSRLKQMLDDHHGNLREVFMQLYDEVESRSPAEH